MHLEQHISLKALHTFGSAVEARYFVEARTADDIHALLKYRSMIRMPVLILGGGSNVLFTRDFNGIVVRINSKGIAIKEEGGQNILLTVQAGENWDGLVQYAVENGLAGLENLSLIPGTVGAAPVQNIGAYGVEVKDVIEAVRFVGIDSGEESTFTKEDCRFAYRDSIFKQALKGKVIILEVVFKLKRQQSPFSSRLRPGHEAIVKELLSMDVVTPGITEVREAVCRIRRRKLPDPQFIGNAGSFFKNPVIPVLHFEELKVLYPEIPFFPAENQVKIPAAWLIDQCGWKGFRSGDAGVHQDQPLVLVNYGNASGKEILNLAEQITESVQTRFRIRLEPEVNIF